MSGSVRVLHVDDDPEFLAVAAAHLERADGSFEVLTAEDAATGLDRLAETDVDCVVSDYRMPGADGIEFLERVRAAHPDLPFVLFTGEGSETVASEAISAGVTDYLQKGTGTAQYEVLANRVRNAVERRRADREVKRLGRQFEALYDNPLVFAAVLEPDGTVRSVNETAEAATGVAAVDCEGDPFAEMPWWTDDPEAVRRQVERAAAGEATRYQVPFLTADGRVATAAGVMIPVEDGDGEVQSVIALGRDVTDAESYLRAAVDALPGPFVLFDTDGRLREWNDALPWATGRDPTSLGSTPLADLVVDEDRAAVAEAVERVRTTGRATVRARVDTGDGAVPFEFRFSRLSPPDDSAPSFVGVGYDVHERERREAALERLHAVTRDLLRAETPAEVADLVAEAAADVLGYPRNVVRLLDGDALRPVAVTDAARSEMGERPTYDVGEGTAGAAFAAGETTAYEDVAAVDDGYDRGGVRSSLFVPVGDHGVLGIGDTEVGTFDEAEVRLTETLAANAAVALDRLEEARARRAEAERLAEFADVVGHDLVTPLATASGWLAEARADHDDDRLGRVADALDRAEAVVEDLRTLTRTSSVEDPDPVDLAALARECWVATAGERGRLGVETDRSVPADEGLFARMLENLFRNSVEHGSTGSRKTESPDDAAGPTVTLGSLAGDDGFYVADDGPGIPETDRERVFESGYTTGAGAGLGLRIVERVAEAHGWSVRVTESETGGARFEVRL
jgi:PAS domain S-box-containing protein